MSVLTSHLTYPNYELCSVEDWSFFPYSLNTKFWTNQNFSVKIRLNNKCIYHPWRVAQKRSLMGDTGARGRSIINDWTVEQLFVEAITIKTHFNAFCVANISLSVRILVAYVRNKFVAIKLDLPRALTKP